MALGWIPAVKQKRQLSIYWTPAALGAGWGPLRRTVIDDFAGISRKHGLGVGLIEVTQPTGANVNITAIGGTVSSIVAGETFSVTVRVNALGGETVAPEGFNGILAAGIFLPAEPQVMRQKALRRVGPQVLRHIVLHELLHACGLETHTATGLFQANPHVQAGDSPATDRVQSSEAPGAPLMPPFFLDPASVSEFKRNW